jgi:hypothetical protein
VLTRRFDLLEEEEEFERGDILIGTPQSLEVCAPSSAKKPEDFDLSTEIVLAFFLLLASSFFKDIAA